MEPLNYHTYNEIKSQTEAWAQAIELVRGTTFPKAEDYDQVLFTGCGSTYYLSLSVQIERREKMEKRFPFIEGIACSGVKR